MRKEIDLREAINAVSDVVQNRPRPLRDFDQNYMKSGDMVLQSEIVANWADNKRLAFIGDGDAISVCTAYLRARNILDYGPSKITVFDFDERIVQAVKRFADKERIENLDAKLYNCFDTFPDVTKFDCFYTNPPWGASNNGESVAVFIERGIDAIRFDGEGMIVIADDDELDWPKQVMARAQGFSAEKGFFVSRLMPKLHRYHLDDAPDLKSCNLIVQSLPRNSLNYAQSTAIIDPERLKNFYGRSKELRVKYVKERKVLDYGRAHEDEYELVLLEDSV